MAKKMVRKLVMVLAFGITVIGCASTTARVGESSRVTFQLARVAGSTGYFAVITGYTGTATDIQIPRVVWSGLTPYTVGEIRPNVFAGKGLTSVSIPNTVRVIGANAFANNQLTEITIPRDTISIGDNAFHNNQLTEVVIPPSVNSIGNNAFANNQLVSVSIPDSVTSIALSAFIGNPTTISTSATRAHEAAQATHEATQATLAEQAAAREARDAAAREAARINREAFNIPVRTTIANANLVGVWEFERALNLTHQELADTLFSGLERLELFNDGTGISSVSQVLFGRRQDFSEAITWQLREGNRLQMTDGFFGTVVYDIDLSVDGTLLIVHESGRNDTSERPRKSMYRRR